MISVVRPKMGCATTEHLEIAMKRQSADTRKPPYPSMGQSGRLLLHEIRFVAGIALALGGAGVLLSDLALRIPSLA